ncbi:TBC1 domain family member 13 [Orchesella cincta]|uniref:TBC1 domain family member 13 n=1 Tax=Orchesella cincta TaxID=48709 RepID=A0A1D2MM56_ORCCI|nr:TBC1 domain family member 13 [Orchesella cincta]
MSYKERLTRLEKLLRVDNQSKRDNANVGGASASSVEKQDDAEETYDSIDLFELKNLVFHGLPGDSQYRALVWRLLLNYLPANSIKSWDEFLVKKRNNYKHFVNDLLVIREESGERNSDHPLNPEPDSKWQVFFKDNDVLLQIDKDVRRLCPEISFFQTETAYPNEQVVSGKMDRLHKRVQSVVLESSNVIRKGLGITKINPKGPMIQDGSETGEYHWEVVERILFIYAKLNPGQSYVQGMNEIIGPIYYTLANDPDVIWRENAEADTFYLFTNLMGEIRDFFIRSLDNSVSGIKRMMEMLMDSLKSRDQAVYAHIVKLEIHPQYFAFRWITLLMSQEFALPEVLRIWDSLLSDHKRFDFLIDLATAMIIHIRSELLSGDFPSNMKLLQNYPPLDVRDILTLANSFSTTSS